MNRELEGKVAIVTGAARAPLTTYGVRPLHPGA
jgi:hypothetical protein